MVLKILCPQERVMDSIALMTETKKGHNFAILGPTGKKYGFAYFFCTDAIYKISSS